MTDRQINELSLNDLLDADSLVLQTAGGQTVRTTGAQLKQFVIDSVPDDVEIDGQPLNTIQSVVFDTGNDGLKTVAFSEIRSHILAQKATTTTFGTSKKATTGAIANPSFVTNVADHYVNPLQLEQKIEDDAKQVDVGGFLSAPYVWLNVSQGPVTDIVVNDNATSDINLLLTEDGSTEFGRNPLILPNFSFIGKNNVTAVLLGVNVDLEHTARVRSGRFSHYNFSLDLDALPTNSSKRKNIGKGGAYVFGHGDSDFDTKTTTDRSYTEVWVPVFDAAGGIKIPMTLRRNLVQSSPTPTLTETSLTVRLTLAGFSSTSNVNL